MDKVGSTSKFRPAASKTEDTTSSSSAEKKAGAVDQFNAAVSSAAKAASALASAAKEQSSSTSGAAKGQERSLEQSVARARVVSTSELAGAASAGASAAGVIETQPQQQEVQRSLRETLSALGHPNAQGVTAEELGKEMAFAAKIEVLGAKLDGSVWRVRAEQGEKAAITGAVRDVFNIPSDVKIDDVPGAVGFLANVEALGGERTEQVWRDFATKGADATLGGLVRDTFGIPTVGTEGMSAPDLLNMAADGHKIGVFDLTTGFVSDWQKYRSGGMTGQAVIDKWGGGSGSSQQPGSGQTGTGTGGSGTSPGSAIHGPSTTVTPGTTGTAGGQESQGGTATGGTDGGQDSGSSSSGGVAGASQGQGGGSSVSETGGTGTSGECVGGLVGYNEAGQPIVEVCLSDSEETSGTGSSGAGGTGSDTSGTGGTSSTGTTGTSGTDGTEDDETDDTEDATVTDAPDDTDEEGALNPDDDRTYYTPPPLTADQIREAMERKGFGGDPAPDQAAGSGQTHTMDEVDPLAFIRSHVDPYASYTGDETGSSGGGTVDPSEVRPPRPDQPVPDEGPELPEGITSPSDRYPDPRVHPGGLNMGGTGEDGEGGGGEEP